MRTWKSFSPIIGCALTGLIVGACAEQSDRTVPVRRDLETYENGQKYAFRRTGYNNYDFKVCIDRKENEGRNTGYVGECGELDGYDFSNQDLRKRNFRGASLREVGFAGTDLREADFRFADLTGVQNFNNVTLLRGALYNARTILPFSTETASVLGMVEKSFEDVDIELSAIICESTESNPQRFHTLLESGAKLRTGQIWQCLVEKHHHEYLKMALQWESPYLPYVFPVFTDWTADEIEPVLHLGLIDVNAKYPMISTTSSLLEYAVSTFDPYPYKKVPGKVLSLLIQYGADVNWADSIKRTPIHYVSTIEAAQTLMSHGANLNPPSEAPTLWLVILGDKFSIKVRHLEPGLVRYLVSAGIPCNVKSGFGKTLYQEVEFIIRNKPSMSYLLDELKESGCAADAPS